jgi:hypothetical protein
MRTADDSLRALNLDMMTQESAGNTAYFEQLLADEFAMRRADLTTFVDRETFIAGVAKSSDRSTEDFDVLLHTSTVAVVRCTVDMVKDGVPSTFTNVRTLVRSSALHSWELLAWVNEPVKQT